MRQLVGPDLAGWLGMAVSHLILVGLLGACSGAIDGDPGSATTNGGGDTMDQPVDIVGPDVLPHVQAFANAACGTLDACHPSTYVGHSPSAERALDILVSDAYGSVPSDDNALGDALAEFALANQSKFAITYVIWRRRINSGTGWREMEDRGSITQNHFDHVHTSYEEMAP